MLVYREYIDVGVAECHDTELGFAKNLESQFANARFDGFPGVGNQFVFGAVSRYAEEIHDGPGGRNGAAGPCSGERRRDHAPTRPVVTVEQHVLFRFAASEQDC